MLTITPAVAKGSKLELFKGVPLDSTYRNVITFDTPVARRNNLISFYDRLDLGSNYSYIRNNRVRVQKPADELHEYNYMVFNNYNYPSEHDYFCFIMDVQYINDNCCEIQFEVDVFSTYLHETTFLPSFVEREHILHDTYGANQIEEGLEVGEYTINLDHNLTLIDCYVAATTFYYKDSTHEDFSPYNGGITERGANTLFTGLNLITFKDKTVNNVFQPAWVQVMEFLIMANNAGKTDGIVSIYTAPISRTDVENCEYMSNSFGEYVPKNKKCLLYPYQFMQLSDFNGQSAIYRFEYFMNDGAAGIIRPKFLVEASNQPDGVVIISPLTYNGFNQATVNPIESMKINTSTEIPWSTDLYSAYVAQNKNVISVQTANAMVNLVADTVHTSLDFINTAVTLGAGTGLSTGGYSLPQAKIIDKAVTSGQTVRNDADKIRGILATLRDKEMLPPQARGSSGMLSSMMLYGCVGCSFVVRQCREEFIRKIDLFFTMYGYKTNELKYPNITGRPYWNFVKTIGANLIVSHNEDAAKIMRSILDSGTTIWHNDHRNIMNYSNDNRRQEDITNA